MPYTWLMAALVAAAAPTTLPNRYMPLKDIRPDMTGVGKTVLKGTEIVEFGVTVVGVLRNIGPKQDMILIRCSGQGLEKTGVISGMSGSPIYIDGKLIGALAYGWRYSKAPLAGVTPIEEMLSIGTAPEAGAKASRTARRPAPAVHRMRPPVRMDGQTYDRLRVLPTAPRVPGPATSVPTLSPIVTPVMVSGADKEIMSRVAPLLERAGCMPVQAGGLTPETPAGLKATLEPGSVCAVSLITGDLDMTAIGTVTDRVGDTIWAFGHPFNGDGKVDMPLSTGAVLAIMPSQSFSFKFGVALAPAGSIVADESAGLRGVVGRPAKTIPLAIQMRLEPRPRDEYQYQLMRHPDYTAGLVRMAMYQSIFARQALPTECTVYLDAALTFAGQEPIRLKNVFAGPDGAFEAVRRVYLTAATMVGNDIKPVDFEGGRVGVRVEAGLQSAYLESLRVDTPKVRPGGEIAARAVLWPHRAEREIVTIKLPVPPETPEGTYTLVICDSANAGRIDLSARPHRLEPRTIEDLFALARDDLDNRHLYARLQLTEAGVAVEGRELPRLPGFALKVFQGSKWSGQITPLRQVLTGSVPSRWVLRGRLQETVIVTRKP